MGNCKGCRHWALADDDRGKAPSWVEPDQQRCFRIVPQADDSSLVKLDNPSFAGENAVLWTAPMFGCVLFEAKESA